MCVIDFESGVVVYDELVKPDEPIVDYLTRWSGIREEDLRGVTRRRKEVQERLTKIFNPQPIDNPFSSKKGVVGREPTPILLGHSLESDLNALRMRHPLVIDTALLFHHPRGRPLKPGLAWLTKKWLGREIQTRGEGGHDAQEDAFACVELVKRKMKEGDGWGTFKMDWESIFERMGRGGGVRSAVVDLGNPGVMHGSRATSCIGCKSDEEVYEGLVDVIPSHRFVFGRFMALANALGCMSLFFSFLCVLIIFKGLRRKRRVTLPPLPQIPLQNPLLTHPNQTHPPSHPSSNSSTTTSPRSTLPCLPGRR